MLLCAATLAPCELIVAAEHEYDLSFRARAAKVSLGEDTGRAQSLRIQAGLRSQWLQEVETEVEIEHVETFSDAEHSDWVRFNGQPIIPDVGGTELNQLFLSYRPGIWKLQLGRFRIELDDQRFVGSDSFWQNDQTFDAASGQVRLLSASRLSYFYVTRVNRIFGEEADRHLSTSDVNFVPLNGRRPDRLLGEHDHDTHLLHAEFNEWDHTSLMAFAYLMENHDDKAASNRTFGAKASYEDKHAGIAYRALAMLAVQELNELPGDPQPLYNLLELGAGISHWRLKAKRESLGADKDTGFTTPLGSQHDFNGWADLFWFTPANGVNDYSLQLRWRQKPWELDLRVHEFHEEQGSDRYGRELDLGLIYKIRRDHNIKLAYARFVSSHAYSGQLDDRTKFYLDYEVGF